MEPLQLKEVIKNETTVFHILDCSMEFFTSETAYGWKVVGEIGGAYHHVSSKYISLITAIELYEYLNNRLITQSEYSSIIKDNSDIKYSDE